MASTDWNALRAQTMGAGQDEEAVTVNTRALIDKVLARYSGEWTVLRELLQNAADAGASKVSIKFDTLPSAKVPLPQNQRSSTHLRHTLLHHTVRSLHVTNNGQIFGPNDWSRLKRIAEGNPDETKIGAFGVGFYSVFDCCEEPFVQSGKEAMAFYWKGNSLFTRRLQLSEAQASSDTTFVLDYRDTTSTIPPLLPLCQFLSSSMTFVGLTGIELWVDDFKIINLNKLSAPGVNVPIPRSLKTKTSEGLMKVESVIHETAQLNATWLTAVGWKPQKQEKSEPEDATAGGTGSLRTFFNRFSGAALRNAAAEKAAREEKAAQEALSEKLTEEVSGTVFMHVNTATVSTSVGRNFAQELERATKKPPPKTTKIAVMTSSFAGGNAALPGIGEQIFSSVLPTKSGRVFIGQITHQTTGLSAHISAQSVIPTVERESIDLQARWVRTWNQELLRACGIVCRLSWLGEIDSVRQALNKSMERAGRKKIAPEDVDKVLPEALHVMNSFTFKESTPSSQVGTFIEEAFWTCNPASSIEILSSRGILPSQHVRIGTDELSFVEGIPIVPPAVFAKASGFVQKLVEVGIITDVTPGDIRKELEAQAISSKQLIEFLKWLTHKVKVNEIDTAITSALLDVTVANDEETKMPIVLAEIKAFINPSKIPPTMPHPHFVIPYKYTSSLERLELEGIGWTSLEIVPWVRWLLENAGHHNVLPEAQDLLKSTEFASQVLPVISKQWDGLSQSSKATVVELLKARTVMPTKLGMRAPSQSYFPSVRLFDDLPVITVNNVKEKFAVALGVRKTIELNLVFDRLLKPKDPSAEGGKSWNHVDLVKYLASVRNDIPKDDIKRLTNTPICPAETPNGPSKELYKASDLFEPNDELKALNVNVLQWPGIFRSGTEDAKFLKQIGLRSYPSANELINIAYNAAQKKDFALQNRALRYILAFHHMHGYSAREIGATTTPFLPLEGSKESLATPSRCFTNEAIAGMGFPILRRDLHPHADRFGVRANMPIDEAVIWLIKNPPDTHRRARELFDYFATRLNELSGEPMEMLKQALIVPITRKSEKGSRTAYLAPSACFLGSGGKYADIFDYVDFGSVSNAFLLRLGAKNDPTISELAWLVVKEPARVFSTFSSSDRYLELLTEFAIAWPSLKKEKDLVKEMKRAPFLLAFKELPPAYSADAANGEDPDEEHEPVKTYQLASASHIVVVDDAINYHIFREHLLASPMEETLESLYTSLGVVTLSSIVEERSRVGSELPDQRPVQNLKRLIQERIKLFFYGMPKDQIRHDASWLDTKLSYAAVQTISVRKTLVGTTTSHTEKRSAVVISQAGKGLTLCISGNMKDLYEVSIELLRLCLYVPKPERAIVLTNLLESPLQLLRQRGYNVDRILRRKQQEAKIAEEARKRQLEEEERRLADQGRHAEEMRQQGLGARSSTPDGTVAPAMPGAFDESPINRAGGSDNSSLWSQFTSRFGGDKRRPQLPQPEGLPMLPDRPQSGVGGQLPQQMTTTPNQGPTTDVGRPMTAPHELQQNLLSAIKASRAHDGESIVSNPNVNDVRETNTFCDSKPAQNIRLLAEVGGMKLFLSRNLDDSAASSFIANNGTALSNFASVLQHIAKAMNLSTSSMHMFWDDSGTIAFNSNRALFFNYRYFESLHLADVQQGKMTDAVVYWFVTLAHELSHNLVADHSAAHSFYTESFIAAYFTRIAAATMGLGTGTPAVAPRTAPGQMS